MKVNCLLSYLNYFKFIILQLHLIFIYFGIKSLKVLDLCYKNNNNKKYRL